MPLPFVSFGGSSLLVMFTAIGLVLNVSRRNAGGPSAPFRGRA
ncbi:MAG TPA: FtsW/RodA/SpoVE family cell cycle protein [Elusimicrobiota bacterium]|nr:FtsW/RodA/SpoVE family cell cycle protein [Elusimicrobiota bacterium]